MAETLAELVVGGAGTASTATPPVGVGWWGTACVVWSVAGVGHPVGS